jgi:ABC-type Fe3+/spermidine/putrescine transport system ATPase subunit
LDVERGELFTFLGPSGSGKSTILHCVAGFLQPTAGSVVLDGRDITNLAPNRRDVGLVFQSYLLFPHKNVFENIAYPLRVRRVAKQAIRTRVDELLGLVDLPGLEDRMPDQLSGGQQQRVALARALAAKPRLLLLDEPLGALDRKLREQMQFEIRRIQRQSGATVLYVTHDQNEAMAISDRVAVLRNGAMEQLGSPRSIYESPCSPFVAGFVGEANLLPASVVSINGSSCSVRCGALTVTEIARPEWLTTLGRGVVMMVRPEHVELRGERESPEGTVSCEVRECFYLGDSTSARCILGDGTPIRVQLPSERYAGFENGKAARLRIPGSRVLLYPAEEKCSQEQTKEK